MPWPWWLWQCTWNASTQQHGSSWHMALWPSLPSLVSWSHCLCLQTTHSASHWWHLSSWDLKLEKKVTRGEGSVWFPIKHFMLFIFKVPAQDPSTLRRIVRKAGSISSLKCWGKARTVPHTLWASVPCYPWTEGDSACSLTRPEGAGWGRMNL